MPRSNVWFVDDLQSNLDYFEEKHFNTFKTRKFLDPEKVLEALDKEKPDALLCDVFFYDTPEKAEEIETIVNKEAERVRSVAHEIEADSDKYLAGIDLMEALKIRYKGKLPFPVYAYTSKGPYLLTQHAWDRIVKSGATILLKKRFGPHIEKRLINKDIKTYKIRNSWYRKIMNLLKIVFITWGIFAALLIFFIDKILFK